MSSSETTQILFNSPALHSLKHNQLAKLCKIHSIKSSGKKVELIQRLKDHAATLPHGSPLSVATRSEQPRDDKDSKRPSEQWELLMEDIPELPEGSSRQTLSSLRSVSGTAPDEFGTGGGSKSSSMSSSLRAIATTFNFKHTPSNKHNDDDRTAPLGITDELASHSVPYSSIPEPPQSDMPQTDHFKFSTPDSTIDEHIRGLPGHPEPLALATGPSGSSAGPPRNTIRLVSAANSTSMLSPLEPGTPQLRPLEPQFDIVMGSPDANGQNRVPVWPLSPQPESSERLYPVLAVDDLDEAKQYQAKSTLSGKNAPSQAPASSTKAKVYPKPSNDVQDIFSPAPKPPGTQERVGIPRSEPFLFGSPLPSHRVSKKAFENAAASVLEEMNKRLSAAGVQKVGTDVFGTIPAATTAATADSGNSRDPSRVDRFDKVHEEQFNKMDSIATHYAARRGAKKRKSDVLGHGSGPAAKRSSASVRVSSAASRKRMGIPGGFDDGEEEEVTVDEVQEEEDRRMSKRVRVLEDDGGKDKGRRLTILPSKTEAEEKQAEKERAATRKMLQLRKEKRRSSRHGGRTSLAGPQATSNKGKATPRFGFLSSAKSIVRSVWNFGVGSPTKASRTGAAATSAKTVSAYAGTAETTKPKPALSKKPSLAPSRPSESLSLGGRKSVAPVRGGSINAASTTTLSRKSSSGDASREKRTVGRSHSRQPSLSSNINTNAGAKLQLHSGSRPSQSVRASATNVNKSASTGMNMTTAEGTDGDGNNSNNDKKTSMIFSPSSRLFAPTASSLAKMRSPSKTSAIVAAQRGAKTTSSPPPDDDDRSPHQDGKKKIFTTPLMLLPNQNQGQTVIPPPVKPTSLAAVATALVTITTTTTTAAAAQSPKSERPTATAGYASPKMTTTTTTKMSAGRPGSARKPRISRSRIIAKLGAQRAATNENGKNNNSTNTNMSSYPSSSSFSSSSMSRPRPPTATGAGAATTIAKPGSRIPRASGSSAVLRTSRVRSSMGTATRRSYAGAKSASRGSDVLMSAKKHARQSEYVRRRSRLVGSTSAVGAAAGEGRRPAADADGRDPDGSTAMDVDED